MTSAVHWHAFAWSGSEVPPDAQCRDPHAPVMPRELAAWFDKPVSLRRGTHTKPDSAYVWLSDELARLMPGDQLAPVLTHSMLHLLQRQDAYVGFYSRGRLHIRCLLTCPRTGGDTQPVRCPGKAT